MKKTLLLSGLIASGSLLSFTTQAAEDSSGFFINGQIGRSHVDKKLTDDNDTGFGINGGYRWGWFGVEVGYVDLGSFNNDVALFGPLGPHTIATAHAKLDGFTLGVNGHFNINDNWYISGRTGAFHFNAKQDYIINGLFQTLARESESGFKPYAGLGFGYDFANNFSLGLNYDYYWADKHDLDVSGDLISLNLEYRFH